MPTATLEGVQLNYRLDGDGPDTVVLVNGLADDLLSWEYQIGALLDAGLRVLRFDNRGVGSSSKPPGPYTTQLFAQDTKALIDHVGLDRFHLLGVSMGGMIAQEFALEWPEGLQSLILACTYARPDAFCQRMFSMWADLATFTGLGPVMRDVTLWAFTPEFFEDRPVEASEFDAAMRMIDQPIPAYLAQLHSIQHHDATDRLHQISAPTLVLAGERDILIPVALSRRLFEAIPGADWATTAGGHACLWEHPEPFNQHVTDFISRTGADL